MDNDKDRKKVDPSKVFKPENIDKVNHIISPSEVDENLEIMPFNPTLLAQNWLTMGFGTIVLKSRSKSYLFKLVEFNKTAIEESHMFLKSNSELELLMTKLMMSSPAQQSGTDQHKGPSAVEIQALLEDPGLKITSSVEECQSLVLSVIRYLDCKVLDLYRECHKYGLVEQTKVALYARYATKLSPDFPRVQNENL